MRRDDMDIVERLVELIETLLRRHPMALRVLLGEVPPPSADEICGMLAPGGADLGSRIQGGMPLPEAQRRVETAEGWSRILERIGGWRGLVAATRAFREFAPDTWKIFLLHVQWGAASGFSHLGSERIVERIAEACSVSTETVWRRRRSVPYLIARAAALVDAEGHLVLGMDDDAKRAATG
jgi:hypothetical protein